MTHIEVSAWIDSYLLSQGVKPKAEQGNAVHYNLLRRDKKGA